MAFLKKEDKIIAIQCDRCGHLIPLRNLEGNQKIAQFSYQFGQTLNSLDNTQIEFDLCADCLQEILNRENIKYRKEIIL
jgi:hypothetical protein